MIPETSEQFTIFDSMTSEQGNYRLIQLQIDRPADFRKLCLLRQWQTLLRLLGSRRKSERGTSESHVGDV